MRYQHNSQKSEKKNCNHARPTESNRTISNQTTTFEIGQSPKLGKIIQTPLYAHPTPLDHQKTSPSFQRPPLCCYSPLTY